MQCNNHESTMEKQILKSKILSPNALQNSGGKLTIKNSTNQTKKGELQSPNK